MSMIGWFPLSRLGPGTEATFQTPTSSVWKILEKLSQHNRQRGEFDPQDPEDCPSADEATFYVQQSQRNGPVAYMRVYTQVPVPMTEFEPPEVRRRQATCCSHNEVAALNYFHEEGTTMTPSLLTDSLPLEAAQHLRELGVGHVMAGLGATSVQRGPFRVPVKGNALGTLVQVVQALGIKGEVFKTTMASCQPCLEFPLHTFFRRFERAPGDPGTPGAEGPAGIPGRNGTDGVNAVAGTPVWKTEEIGYIAPDQAATSHVRNVRGSTYYLNVYVSLNQIRSQIPLKTEAVVRVNIQACLRDTALEWYTSELTDAERDKIREEFVKSYPPLERLNWMPFEPLAGHLIWDSAAEKLQFIDFRMAMEAGWPKRTPLPPHKKKDRIDSDGVPMSDIWQLSGLAIPPDNLKHLGELSAWQL
ncbi:unnamed protein product [Penicillium salamii]|uniref:Uncharacterized protein n=1 Tax=Penicillium salamii TaxID=1612424 RepID=A0A9W4NIP7_9EURO|nr:unnamed protein product [Penicillium salamii]CAG8171321.1 unnamed protein product [Penicillium salamii]CAG8226648.1 unnamed protein product [Penicillium salamii]CAG8320386.1 unnamed protein product [Penicillium salamii]CAG8371961.1 unnamed protein product [Penicillium salamii]